jgi:hypothetical protein
MEITEGSSYLYALSGTAPVYAWLIAEVPPAPRGNMSDSAIVIINLTLAICMRHCRLNFFPSC